MDKLFPNGITAEALSSFFVALYAIVISFYNLTIKRKVIKSDIQQTNSERASNNAENKADAALRGVNILGNMMLTVYLNANTLDDTTKKRIASYAVELDNISGITIDKAILQMADIVSKFKPEATIVEQKEKLVEHKYKKEEQLDDVNRKTQEALNKLKL
jgi:hypothetical protein